MRFLLLLVVAVPLAAQVQSQQSLQSLSPFQREKARVLLREQLPCLGCHELNGEGGHSAPSLTGIAARRDPAWIRAMIVAPQSLVAGTTMPAIPMPPRTRNLIVAYLAGTDVDSQPLRAAAPPPAVNAAAASAPAALYAKWCATCHGASGRGDGPNARFLPIAPAVHASAAQMAARSDDMLFDAIAGGGWVMGKSPRMPAFGQTLSSAEIRSLVGYIRVLCACRGPAWSSDDRR
ncbi:MAG TPA: c-type cytochrome [Gemmatimonadaceae bacterium]|nr:c-type cytochrome [Gemmatimonadaceae bacterium]